MNNTDPAGELALMQRFLIPDNIEFSHRVGERHPWLLDEYCRWIEATGQTDSWALFRRYVAEYELVSGCE